jgi:NOL1/NOP2/sun family putative RNA methylase
MVQLPEAYIHHIKKLLGNEADAFLKSCQLPKTQGLRINPLKIKDAEAADHRTGEHIIKRLEKLFGLRAVPWCPIGYYYDDNTRPGKHPYHAAGLYYIQEPSAMSAVELLDPQPGETILDLAAAPGGKSTHIAGKMRGRGLLIANEIHPARAKALSENIERFGVRNCIVTNASPDELAKRFPLFFDRIMVDAPCSGEGMFRKDPDAIAEWSPEQVQVCSTRQMDILRQAVPMLKAGGTLAYSTCTFSREENEDVIEQLIKEYPDMEVQTTERIWPHQHEGEGHFVAVIRKAGNVQGDQEDAAIPKKSEGKISRQSAKSDAAAVWTRFKVWAREALPGWSKEAGLPPGEALMFGDQLYWLPHDPAGRLRQSMLNGLKILRPGLHLAERKKNRIEPAHALALAIQKEDAAQSVVFPHDSNGIAAYLKGETVDVDDKTHGWVLVTADGFPVGWGKASQGQMKNHFPKGLRWLK